MMAEIESLRTIIAAWIVGLAFSVGIGHFVVSWAIPGMRAALGLQSKFDPDIKQEDIDFSTAFVGLIERLFFTIAIGANIPGTIVAMTVWIGLKMGANWLLARKDNESPDERLERIGFASTALIGGLFSMTFALVGGLICQLGNS